MHLVERVEATVPERIVRGYTFNESVGFCGGARRGGESI